MKRKYKIRYHLGAGENYMKWRVEDTTSKEVKFLDTEDFEMSLKNAKLYNQKGAADNIYNGASKTVCAWIMAEEIFPNPDYMFVAFDKIISYNPRVAPYWRDHNGKNVDKQEFEEIYIDKEEIFTLK